jgi:uncharacterized protein (DUF433 family)
MSTYHVFRILNNPTASVSHEEILKCYPSLPPENIRAAIAYAAEKLSRMLKKGGDA